MIGTELLKRINSGRGEEVFTPLYGPGGVAAARNRYNGLAGEILGLQKFPKPQNSGKTEKSAGDFSWDFPEVQGDLRFFSAPGRTELGGNHTDHNRGNVLAASIQLDSAAIAAPRKDKWVFFRSSGYPDVIVNLAGSSGSLDLSPKPGERGSTEALVRGIAAEFAARGIEPGGFTVCAASTVLPGSGLSSSAAVEVLLARIFDNLYGGGKCSALEIAQMSQRAENNYFGKPSGLMDQAACAFGGAVSINFADADRPLVKAINFDLAPAAYALCVADTKGSHADLTDDYAAIPEEMKAVAGFFGKTALRELEAETVLSRAGDLRKALGDRALLRAMHFFNENRRVDAMGEALAGMDAAAGPEAKRRTLGLYLDLVNESGDSSWELLQNIYTPKNSREQGISLALALTKEFLRGLKGKGGACRVHGGGFAGTIQAYIPLDAMEAYRTKIEAVFGAGTVTELRIRPVGTTELDFR
jgi:galactokinase